MTQRKSFFIGTINVINLSVNLQDAVPFYNIVFVKDQYQLVVTFSQTGLTILPIVLTFSRTGELPILFIEIDSIYEYLSLAKGS